ncbi:MAG: hypothetical protein HY914_23250 [Desulfomonile tiedjei]|nr:hypothetical protein [Desulfomonile tiedjei]
MNPPNDFDSGFDEFTPQAEKSVSKRVTAEDVLADLRAGLRTKHFLEKYGLSLAEFEKLLRDLIVKGRFTKEEFRRWKEHRPASPPPAAPKRPVLEVESATRTGSDNVTTWVINDPERNNSWALQLFSIKRESIRGARFKVNLHGRKYAFVVEQLLFRGQISMFGEDAPDESKVKDRRDDAVKFIAQHGWAAYLERRAFTANFEREAAAGPRKKARLVLLHCRNETFLAALHTPTPAISLYVGSSLQNVLNRLGKSVDTSELNL